MHPNIRVKKNQHYNSSILYISCTTTWTTQNTSVPKQCNTRNTNLHVEPKTDNHAASVHSMMIVATSCDNCP